MKYKLTILNQGFLETKYRNGRAGDAKAISAYTFPNSNSFFK